MCVQHIFYDGIVSGNVSNTFQDCFLFSGLLVPKVDLEYPLCEQLHVQYVRNPFSIFRVLVSRLASGRSSEHFGQLLVILGTIGVTCCCTESCSKSILFSVSFLRRLLAGTYK